MKPMALLLGAAPALALAMNAAAQTAELPAAQQQTVEILQDFRTCVAQGAKDPAYAADLEAIQAWQQDFDANVDYEAEMLAIDKYHAQADAILYNEGYIERLYNAGDDATYREIKREAIAFVEAKLGPVPQEPEQPDFFTDLPIELLDDCSDAMGNAVLAAGHDLATFQDAMYALLDAQGAEGVKTLTAPKLAP